VPDHCFLTTCWTAWETSSANALTLSITFPMDPAGVYVKAILHGSVIAGTAA